MKSAVPSREDIRIKAFSILRRELSRSEFVCFLQSLYNTRGDYTKERPELIDHLTVDEIIADIDARRAN